MKNTRVALIFLAAMIAAFALGIWAGHKDSAKAVAASGVHAPAMKPNAPHVAPNILALQDWQKLRNARETILKNNPDLGAEYKSILAEMDAQQKELDAAMIKADPKVAPIMAKLKAMRKHNSIPDGTVSSR